MLQIASQSLKQCQNRGGRMPRNPRPDQIGMGGRMLSVQVAGSPRNTHLTPDQTHRIRVDQEDIPADLDVTDFAGVIVGSGHWGQGRGQTYGRGSSKLLHLQQGSR